MPLILALIPSNNPCRASELVTFVMVTTGSIVLLLVVGNHQQTEQD